MIREATQHDSAAIARVHVASWKHTYRGHFPDRYLDDLKAEDSQARWEEITPRNKGNVAVAVVDGAVVGFLSLMPSRDEGAPSTTGEISAFYVHPDILRQGIGTQLMSWAYRRAVANGWDRLTLWVLEGNRGARRFYEQLGWLTDGATKLDERPEFSASEVRYVWQLST